MREHDIHSADGTRIRVWHNDGTGRDVLLCPGIGTMPEAWPYLTRPAAHPGRPRPRMHSWYHRGTLGSARPADPTRIRLADHVADALAVLDEATVERAVVMGWSAGASVATELASRYPDRVSGLLLVAGTPGDLFGGMLGVLGVPHATRRRMAGFAARLIRDAGPLLNAVLHRLPMNSATAAVVRHSGVMRPTSRPADVVAAGRRFLSHDWGWYGQLALALAETAAPDLAKVCCPVTALAGRYDLFADPRHVVATIGPLPQARIRVLPTSHFLPLEAPDELAAELMLLIERADAVRAAALWASQAVPAAPARPILVSDVPAMPAPRRSSERTPAPAR
ncbi:MAG TPA: alpha/beta hydrolase [Pseudonocardiaceae bacterium]|nr:alpha/beta hydrolase [Pseudonocardiaceae bacterium]